MPRLSDLLDAAAIQPLDLLASDPWVDEAHLDSRAVTKGSLFFALRGEHLDGERFVPQALERGATAIVAQSARPQQLDDAIGWVRLDDPRAAVGPISRQLHGCPDQAMELIGVTGTNGKTTVTFMLQAIANAAGKPGGRIGTTGYAFGDDEAPLPRTTPEATDLFRILQRMQQSGAQSVAMEVSSHALSLHRVASAQFAAAVFLNLTRDHLDYYGTEERYFDAKAQLFDMLAPGAIAVAPADDRWGDALQQRVNARWTTFGRTANADVRLTQERCRLDGSSATLETPGGSIEIDLPLPGRFNLDNAAAAAATAIAMGCPLEAVQQGLASMPFVPGRVQRIDGGQPFDVWVDYAHTPDALRNLLGWAKPLVPQRLIVVFGCGGDRDRGKRPEMAQAVGEFADAVWVTSDNPRGEDPQQIIDDTLPGLDREQLNVNSDTDRERAIAAAFELAEAGDLVVLAGKGHENTMTIGERTFEFDDRKVAQRLLDARWGTSRA